MWVISAVPEQPGSGKFASGYFNIGTNSSNSLVVQNLYIANFTYAAPVDTMTCSGVFSVGGGTVMAGAVTLAQQMGSGLATGTLQLNTGARMNVTGSITNGGGTSTISVSDATLNVGGVVGSPTANIGTLNLSNATLGLTLVSPGDYTNAAASVSALNIDGLAGSTVIKINSTNPPGQYPLIAYGSMGGLTGFDGLTVQAAPGTTATLSNNVSRYPYTVDAVITAPAVLVFTTAPFTQTAGVLSGTITVQLQTGAGTPINTTSNLTVNLSTTSASGVFRDLGDTTTISSVVIPTGSSSASFRYRDTLAPTTPTLTATTPAFPPAVQQETITVGAAAKLGFTPAPANGFVGVTLSPIVVQIQDAYGNPVLQSGTSVTLTLNGGTLAGGTTTQTTDGNGQATFNDLLIMESATGINFSAAAAGLLTATSSNFNVTYRTIVKAKNTDNMDLTTSWIGGVVPGQYDVAVINDSSVPNSSANAHADLAVSSTWHGLFASYWSGNTGYRVDNNYGSTLTLGAGGIVGSNVNHTLTFAPNIALATPQVWQWDGTGGTLILNGGIDNGGYLLTLGGSRGITVNGVVTGSRQPDQTGHQHPYPCWRQHLLRRYHREQRHGAGERFAGRGRVGDGRRGNFGGAWGDCRRGDGAKRCPACARLDKYRDPLHQ